MIVGETSVSYTCWVAARNGSLLSLSWSNFHSWWCSLWNQREPCSAEDGRPLWCHIKQSSWRQVVSVDRLCIPQTVPVCFASWGSKSGANNSCCHRWSTHLQTYSMNLPDQGLRLYHPGSFLWSYLWAVSWSESWTWLTACCCSVLCADTVSSWSPWSLFKLS